METRISGAVNHSLSQGERAHLALRRSRLGSNASRGKLGIQSSRRFHETRKFGRDTFVLLAIALHNTGLDQVLQLLVHPQAEHLLTAAGGLPSFEIGVDFEKQRVELKRRFGGKHRGELFGDTIWTTSRIGVVRLHQAK